MTFWLIAGAMTLLVVGALLVPLLRRPAEAAARGDYDLTVYRDQLAELDRDLARGVLTEDQVAAARLEIERRMLAATEAAQTGLDKTQGAKPHRTTKRGQRKAAAGGAARPLAAGVAIALPVAAIALYVTLGAPGVPGVPFAERQEEQQAAGGLANLAESMALRLQREGGQADEWLLLGRTYAELGRFGEAAGAAREAIDRGAADVESRAFLGEMLVAANDGTVVPEARGAFAWVLERDRGNVRGLYYAGLALSQDGRTQEALDLWLALERASPADAPWRPLLRQQIASAAETLGIEAPAMTAGEAATAGAPAAGGAAREAPGPSQAEVAAAAEMSEEERQAFIRSMVDRLATRLEEEPDDFDGWLRLARAYSVLGESDKAADALDRADELTAALPADAPERQALNQARAALGVAQ